MTFRDDREALRQKTESLESELSAARRELAEKAEQDDRIRDLEKQLGKARERLERVDPAMQAQKRPASGQTVIVILAGVLVAMAMCGGTAALFLLRSTSRPPPPEPAVQSPPPIVPPPEPPPPEPVRELKVTWGGEVRTAKGLVLPPNARCSLEAMIRSRGSYHAKLSCGERVLYDSNDPLNGMAHTSASHFETPGPEPGSYRYWLMLDDQGTRTGRSQVSIDTKMGTAVAWTDGATAFRVEVAIDELGVPTGVSSPPLDPLRTSERLQFVERVYRKGKVNSTTNGAPVKAGVGCEAFLVPQWEEALDCRLTVTCGDAVVYGGTKFGFGKCDVDARTRKATAFHDATVAGDPAVELDLNTGRLVIEGKTTDGRDWMVTIGL